MPLRTISDEGLLARIRQHDESALRELVNRHYVRLANFAFSLLRQRDSADEAVMNVFLNLWRRRTTLNINGELRSYLLAAVGNQTVNVRKRQRRHTAEELDEVLLGKLASATRTDEALLFRELQAEVDELILTLPPQRQLIFRLNRIEGLDYATIAKALGVSKHTVQNHMVAAIRQLAPELPKIRRALRS